VNSKPKDRPERIRDAGVDSEIPEADALDQARAVDDEPDDAPVQTTPPDASEADVLEQRMDVPDEDGYEPRS
jgi:hypothetical protein